MRRRARRLVRHGSSLLLAFAAGLFVLSGCTADAPSTDETAADAPVRTAQSNGTPLYPAWDTSEGQTVRKEALTSFKFGTPDRLRDDSQRIRALGRDIGHVSRVMQSFHRIAAEASSWRAADRQIQAHLSATDTSSVPRYIREQSAAGAMFRNVFIDWTTPLTDAQRDVLGDYVQLLAENQNPEAALVLPALRQLEGHWADRHVASTADAIAKAADRAYKAPSRPDDTTGTPTIDADYVLQVADSLRALRDRLHPDAQTEG
jgi:hypothetical protein